MYAFFHPALAQTRDHSRPNYTGTHSLSYDTLVQTWNKWHYIKCSVVSLVRHFVWKVTVVSLGSRVLADWLIQTHKRVLFNRWTKHNMRIFGVIPMEMRCRTRTPFVKKNSVYYDKTQPANFWGKCCFDTETLLTKELNQKQTGILNLIFHHLSVVELLVCSLQKELTPKICMLCFVIINSILFVM